MGKTHQKGKAKRARRKALDESIQAWHAALAKEQESRDCVFFDSLYEIGGIPIRVMRLCDFLTLVVMRSPFVHGGQPIGRDNSHFLWVLSPEFDPLNEGAREAFVHHSDKLSPSATMNEIYEYLDIVFLDAPGGRGNAAPSVSFVAMIVAQLAMHLHFSEADVLVMPMPRIYQYLRAIAKLRGGNAPLINRISDRARAHFLDLLNAMPAKEQAEWHEEQNARRGA